MSDFTIIFLRVLFWILFFWKNIGIADSYTKATPSFFSLGLLSLIVIFFGLLGSSGIVLLIGFLFYVFWGFLVYTFFREKYGLSILNGWK